jgi:hypothetical protein
VRIPVVPRRAPVSASAVLVAPLLLLAPGALAAQSVPSGPGAPDVASLPVVHRLSSSIVLDGVVDEPAWDLVPPVPLFQHIPTVGGPMTERTELRIAHDDDYVYLAARNYLRDASTLSETTYKRDSWSDEDDQVALMLDTFDDSENGVAFVLYPTGARIDASVRNDARTMASVNVDWNTFWDGAVSRDEEGWYAEMRIPISSLSFETDAEGRVRMGVIAYRYIARNGELQVFPAVPPDWGFWSFVKPSKAERMIFDGLERRRPFYVTPYVLGGLVQRHELDESGTRYIRSSDTRREIGGDVKFGLSSNATLDVTVNTDFAQVEADDQQVNLTRFSLFFPEKRQFFLERIGNFAFDFDGSNQLFYSRRIGLRGGEQVPLLGGLRMVARAGSTDLGGLLMRSRRIGDTPAESFGVMRFKRQLLNDNSYIGQIATLRLDDERIYNLALGIDARINTFGDDYLTFALAKTLESDGVNFQTTWDNARVWAEWRNTREVGLAYNVGFAHSGAEYRPGLGFESRRDYTAMTAGSTFRWRPGEESRIREQGFVLASTTYLRNEDHSLESGSLDLSYSATLRSNHVFRTGMTASEEDLRERFELSDEAWVPAGRYRALEGRIGYTMPTRYPLRSNVDVSVGRFLDGTRRSVSLSPFWTPTPRLKVTGAYVWNHITFGARDQVFTAHVARVQPELMFDTRVSVSALAQYNSAAADFSVNARLRINPREGTDFYLVFSESLRTDQFGFLVPVPPRSRGRTLLLKYSRTLFP